MLAGIVTAIGYKTFFLEKPELNPRDVKLLYRNEFRLNEMGGSAVSLLGDN